MDIPFLPTLLSPHVTAAFSLFFSEFMRSAVNLASELLEKADNIPALQDTGMAFQYACEAAGLLRELGKTQSPKPTEWLPESQEVTEAIQELLNAFEEIRSDEEVMASSLQDENREEDTTVASTGTNGSAEPLELAEPTKSAVPATPESASSAASAEAEHAAPAKEDRAESIAPLAAKVPTERAPSEEAPPARRQVEDSVAAGASERLPESATEDPVDREPPAEAQPATPASERLPESATEDPVDREPPAEAQPATPAAEALTSAPAAADPAVVQPITDYGAATESTGRAEAAGAEQRARAAAAIQRAAARGRGGEAEYWQSVGREKAAAEAEKRAKLRDAAKENAAGAEAAARGREGEAEYWQSVGREKAAAEAEKRAKLRDAAKENAAGAEAAARGREGEAEYWQSVGREKAAAEAEKRAKLRDAAKAHAAGAEAAAKAGFAIGEAAARAGEAIGREAAARFAAKYMQRYLQQQQLPIPTGSLHRLDIALARVPQVFPIAAAATINAVSAIVGSSQVVAGAMADKAEEIRSRNHRQHPLRKYT